ncbi:ATP-binding protein [Streptomyces sp. NBC_01190]|uniref:ATP-binding protein n=1 Tax=Streptomyces sp. NBC_01190 TaxID=2903767 RepID=UPI00386838CB|nr:ATP-binding protein [Streptomyces sp. NBC_01190]
MNVPPCAPVVVCNWPKHPESVGLARRHLRGVLDRWGTARISETAEVVLSELVTNAARHSHNSDRLIEIRYQPMPDGSLSIEVHDDDDRLPVMRRAAEDDESGRGLSIVDALTDGRWGVLPRSPREGAGAIGKFVWALVGPGGW